MEVDETAPTDPELQAWLDSVAEHRQKLDALIHTPLPAYPNPRLASLSDSILAETPITSLSRQQQKDLLSPIVDSSALSLTGLCRQVMQMYPDLQLNTEELKELVHEFASRIAHGVRDKRKDVYEDEDRKGFWAWQIDAFPQPSDILRERKLLGKVIQSLWNLISTIEKKKPSIVKIKNQYDEYNKANKKLDIFRAEKNEKKRKRETTELERSAKKQKIEQEREEKRAKLLEEKQRMETEKKAKAEAEKRAKQEQQTTKKTPIKEINAQISAQQRTLAGYFSTEKKAAGPRANYKWIFGPELTLSLPKPFEYMQGANLPCFSEGLEGWKRFFRMEIRRLPPRTAKFIYHAESALKPYFVGMKTATLQFRRNPFRHYAEVDYEKDSDEEFEELNAEDIASSRDSSSESDDAASDEEESKWIVPDGYLSQDERTDEEEPATVVREEFVSKPSIVLAAEDPLLQTLRGFSIASAEFPISCEIAEAKDQAPLNLEDLRKIVQENPYKKDQIIVAYKTLHPATPKSQIRKAIEAYFLKEDKKGGKKRYLYKDDVPSKPPVFIIIKT